MLLLAGVAYAVDVMPAKFRLEPVARNLDHPEEMVAAPDGRIFFAERTTGNIRIIKNGQLLADPFVTLTVHGGAEEGVLGIALHPDFLVNHWVYIYYSSADPQTQQVVRYQDKADRGVGKTVILDNIGEDTDGHDNGGGMVFGADRKLYVGVGVFDADPQSQSMTSLQGKVLRLNDDGTVPADNPHLTEPHPYDLIYARGFRDVQDLAVHAGVGTLYGPDQYENDAACDETNVVRSGQNYGWNLASCSAGGYTGPLQSISPPIGVAATASYSGTKYPGMTNNLFVAGSSNGKILRNVLTGANFDALSSSSEFYFPSGTNCPVALKDVTQGKDGWLYVVSEDPNPTKAGLYRAIYQDYGWDATANQTKNRAREVSATPHIPLMVTKEGTGLKLWWEDLKRGAWAYSPGHLPTGGKNTKYTIWSGNLTTPFSYNHTTAPVEYDGDDTGDALLTYTISSMPSENKYYLVSARSSNFEGPTGYASNGTQRPGYTGADLDRCNAIGFANNTVNKCASAWPKQYPDQYNRMWDIDDFRGKAFMIAYMQFG